MQQKVQFLAAIIHDPDVIILDEPFSGLDPVNAELINRLICELNDAGKTIIFSTHVLHQAEQLCDRIFLINHGKKLLDATLEEIRARFDPRTLVVEPLVAEPMAAHTGLERTEGVLRAKSIDQGDAVELHLGDGVDPQRVMQDVVANHPIRSIRLRQLSLQEVFVRLVRRDEGAEAAERVHEELSHA